MTNTILKIFSLTISFIFIASDSFALVDYGSFDSNTSSGRNSFSPRQSAPKSVRKATKTKNRSNQKQTSVSSRRMFSVNSRYEALTIDGIEESKIDFLKMSALLDTPFGIYFNFAYWEASPTYGKFVDEGFSEGNFKMLGGVNWFQVGSGMDKTRLDIYLGASLPSTEGEIGRSSLDKYIGIQTIKKIFDFYLNIDLQAMLSGAPKDTSELEIGTVFSIKPEIAYTATNDIRFALSASIVNVQGLNSDTKINYLKENVSFSYLSPRLDLLLSPFFNLELGGHIRLNKVKKIKIEEMKDAKLFDFPGLYGNSFYVSVNFSV